MKNRYLFPHRFKMIGWILFAVGIIMLSSNFILGKPLFSLQGYAFAIYDDEFLLGTEQFSWVSNDFYDEIIAILIIVGGLLAAFSKERDEDEYIAKIRLESLLWATYTNYGFLLLFVIFIYGMAFLHILFYNIFLLLFIFLIRFNFILYRSKHSYA